MAKKKKACGSKRCSKSCKKNTKTNTRKILSIKPLVYIEPIEPVVPEDTTWTKILKFFRLK